MSIVPLRFHPRPAQVLLGTALFSLSIAAPAALVTVDFTDRVGNGTTSFSKTAGDVTLSFFSNDPVDDSFDVGGNGLSLNPSVMQSFDVSFDRDVDLASWTGSFNGPPLPSPQPGFTISGPGVSSANTMSTAGDFSGQPLAIQANQTYRIALTGAGELAFATWSFEPGETAVPIPATPLLLAAGLAGLVGSRRSRSRR
jgi:hypothetical protein